MLRFVRFQSVRLLYKYMHNNVRIDMLRLKKQYRDQICSDMELQGAVMTALGVKDQRSIKGLCERNSSRLTEAKCLQVLTKRLKKPQSELLEKAN